MLWPLRLFIRIGTAFVVLVILAVAVGWGWFRYEAKSWAWWRPPQVLSVNGRHYQRSSAPAVSLASAQHVGSGAWGRVGHELPMFWDEWAHRIPGATPTAVFLCTRANHCFEYSLEGGP